MTDWIKFTHNDAAPHDRRILMIGYSEPPAEHQKPDLFVAHWHAGKEEWVSVEPPRISGRDHPDRVVIPVYWADAPDCPEGIEFRPLAIEDTYG
jgi:hypothetical protein